MNVLLKQCFIILIYFLYTIDCTDNFQQELFGDGEFSKQDKVRGFLIFNHLNGLV